MAGSYLHVTNHEDGSLCTPKVVHDMLDTGGDVFEAVEEMYGMIWFLASHGQLRDATNMTAKQLIEEARINYIEGLVMSPTRRYPLR